MTGLYFYIVILNVLTIFLAFKVRKQKEENNINKKLTIDLFKKQVDLIENFATAKTPEEFCDYFFKHFGIKI